MSKNITIQEGGTAKQMTVSKLKTDVTGGGSCTWLPEDEVSLGTKSITANGTYKASDDGKYGFSQVTVNVAGAAGSANPDGSPSIGGGATTGDTGGDTGSIGGGATTGDTGGDTGSPAGGPGSCVVGTDPITGNEQAVGVDSSGNLVTTPIPSSLEIVRNPDNTSYQDGSPIDLTGATVIARNADGSLWTSEDYPDGIIPISELTLETPTADSSLVQARTAGGFTVIDPRGKSSGDIYSESPDHMDGAGQATFHNVQITVPEGSLVTLTANYLGTDRSLSAHSAHVYNQNSRVAFFAIEESGDYLLGFTAVSGNTGTWGSFRGGTLSYLCGGDITAQGGQQEVPIRWTRPADRKILETLFAITLSLGDDSGSSSSGGGTTF